VADGVIALVVEHDGINVGCGDAITPWSLTEEFGPLAPATYSITATLYAVDPNDRQNRILESGPDVLVETYPVPEPASAVLFILGLLTLIWKKENPRMTKPDHGSLTQAPSCRCCPACVLATPRNVRANRAGTGHCRAERAAG
jgi:hypothetical protein